MALYELICLLLIFGGVSCWDCDPAAPNASANIMCFTDGTCEGGQKLIRSGVFSEDEKSATLHFHNMMRELVASGQLEFHPSATHMWQVIWDDTVASAAAKYAAQCVDNQKAKRAIGTYADANNDQYLKLEYLQDHSAFPYYKNMVRSIFGSVCHKEVKLHMEFVKIPGKSIAWAQLIYENFTRMGCGYSEFTSHRQHHHTGDMEMVNVTFHVCLYGKMIPNKGKYVYVPGTHSCEVTSKLYPSLCSSDEINAEYHTKSCADSQFGSKYELLCRRINPLWFCNVENLFKLEEEFNDSDAAESCSLFGIIMWVLLGVVLPSLISGFVWWFWDELKDCFFDFLFEYVCR